MQSNTQKTVLITGATSGLGLEMTKILAAQGYQLILTGRSEEKLTVALRALPQMTTPPVTFLADFSNPAGAEKLWRDVQAQGLTVDILINNAGHGSYGETVEMSPETVRAMLTCNVLALTELSIRFGKQMKQRRGGMILNIASTAAYQPVPFMGAYAASKSYVLFFSEALAAELAPYDVSVTSFAPGATDTNFFTTAKMTGTAPAVLEKTARAPVERVAEAALNALFNKKMTAMYGGQSRLLNFFTRLLPRRAVVAVTKRIMQE